MPRDRIGVGRLWGRVRLLGVGLFALVLLAACFSVTSPHPKRQVIEETEFDPSLGIDLTQMQQTFGGMYYQDLTVGDGQPAQAGDTISIGYEGWLSNATRFAASDSAVFIVGIGALISGLDIGILGNGVDPMRVGGERKLVIPSSLAYGDVGSGPVGGGKIVIFDITLKGIGGITP